MVSNNADITTLICHLNTIRNRLDGKSYGVVQASIAELHTIVKTREGIANDFSFALSAIPVHTAQATLTAPQVISIIDSYISYLNSGLKVEEPEKNTITPRPLVDPARIHQLKTTKNRDFDLIRLIRYCEELNGTYAMGCYLAVAMLTRAVLDHVPPIFNFKSFSEVANNYKGSKSFKELMIGLDSTTRKIADAHLHTQIRSKEILPNAIQIDCSSSLDYLLSEIVRILK